MSGASSLLLAIHFVAVCVGLAGIIAGGIGYSWWKTELVPGTVTEIGLWRACIKNVQASSSETKCTRRENILKFKDATLMEPKNKEKDIILALLIGGAFFSFITMITIASMCCCQRSRFGWFCGCILACICCFLSGGLAIGGLVFAQIEIDWKEPTERGWSVITTWIGAAMNLLAFILTIILCIFAPKNSTSTHYLNHSMQLR